MKSITVHGMDEELDRRLRDKAEAEGKSLNKTIKGLLEESLGVRPARNRREEFRELFGSWSTEEREQFDRATEDFGVVNAEDWQ